MLESQQDKKLVERQKQTNKMLHNQLLTLNDQIDKILLKKSHKIGLKQLPKTVTKTTDIHVVQYEIQNMKKKLEQISIEKQLLKQKSTKNYTVEIANLYEQMLQKQTQISNLKMQIKDQQRNQKINFYRSQDHESELLKKIQNINSEINRFTKIQKQLKRTIHQQQANFNRKDNFIVQREEQKKQLSQTVPVKEQVMVEKSTTNNYNEDESWKQLKKQFLKLKQSKYLEQQKLYEENDRLRKEIRIMQQKINKKKGKINFLHVSAQRSYKNNSVLEKHTQQKKNYRYRDRNNSIQYTKAGKTLDV